jgi:hypothetical protein
MPHALLAELVLALHLAWIAFMVCGLVLAWRWPRRAWLARLHLAGLVLLLLLNLGGWYCPLTYLEDWLRRPAGPGPEASFLAAGLQRLVYPPLAEAWLRLLGGVWAALNLAGHACLARRRRNLRAGRESR